MDSIFATKDFEGKIWVVDFFFTSCPTICPVMTSHMVAVQDAFADHSIGIASFSIDPEVDTPEVLQTYAQEKGVRSPHWHLLTGDEKEIYRIANEGFNIYAKAGDTPENFEHSGLFALVDTRGNIICRKEKGKPILFYNGMTPEGIAMLVEDIKKLKTITFFILFILKKFPCSAQETLRPTLSYRPKYCPTDSQYLIRNRV